MTDQPATTNLLTELKTWRDLYGPGGDYIVPDKIRINRAIARLELQDRELLECAEAIAKHLNDNALLKLKVEVLENALAIAREAGAEVSPIFIEQLKREILRVNRDYQVLYAEAIQRAEDAEYRLNEVTNALKCQHQSFNFLAANDNPAGTIMDAIQSMLDLPDDLAHGYGPLNPNSPPEFIITWRAGVHRGWLEFGKRLVAALTKGGQ